MNRIHKSLIALPWFLAILGFGWLVSLRFPISGIFVADSRVDGNNPWIFTFLPSERTTASGRQPDGWTGQKITGDPVYIAARVPGPYTSAEVAIEYRPIRQTFLEFGMSGSDGAPFILAPMYAEELRDPTWTRVEIPARGFVHTGVAAARLLDPDPRGLVVWRASSTMPLFSDVIAPLTPVRVSLRGAHDFYFVPSARTLRVTFHFQDVNRKPGSDAIAIRVFRGAEELVDQTYAESVGHEGKMGAVQTHTVSIPRAAPGVYRISFIASDDIFIRSIDTTSKRWVVGPRVYIGDTVGYPDPTFPDRLWTTSRHLVAETFHAEGLQTIGLGSQKGIISRTHTLFRLNRSDAEISTVMLTIPNGDAKVVLDGFAAVSPEAFFEPMPHRFTDATQLAKEGIHAVLTPYAPPRTLEDGWLRSTFLFSTPKRADTIRFVLSAPGVGDRLGSVDVRRITVTYRRSAQNFRDWLRALRQELSNALHRI